MDLVTRNSKTPDLVAGDIACEVGAVTLAERRLNELLERYGTEKIKAATDEIISATEGDVRDRIRQIPGGIYSEEKLLDPDPIKSGTETPPDCYSVFARCLARERLLRDDGFH